MMLAKITSKNQITIPKKIMEQFPETQYVDVQVQDGTILLRPLRTESMDLENIRRKIQKLGLESDTVREAVKWARK